MSMKIDQEGGVFFTIRMRQYNMTEFPEVKFKGLGLK